MVSALLWIFDCSLPPGKQRTNVGTGLQMNSGLVCISGTHETVSQDRRPPSREPDPPVPGARAPAATPTEVLADGVENVLKPLYSKGGMSRRLPTRSRNIEVCPVGQEARGRAPAPSRFRWLASRQAVYMYRPQYPSHLLQIVLGSAGGRCPRDPTRSAHARAVKVAREPVAWVDGRLVCGLVHGGGCSELLIRRRHGREHTRHLVRAYKVHSQAHRGPPAAGNAYRQVRGGERR